MKRLSGIQHLQVPGDAPKAHRPKHTIMIIDVSGSMWGNLEQIGMNLQSDIARFMKPGDQISVIWFSGRDQTGTVLKHETIDTLGDAKRVEKLVKQWLKPVGLTGFKEPLELATQLVEEGKLPSQVIFMSDGMDNQWKRDQIEAAARKLGEKLENATVIEFGRWADRQMLSRIAELLGGVKETVEGEERFIEMYTQVTSQGQVTPRVAVEVPQGTQYVGTIEAGMLSIYQVEEGKALLPEGTASAFAFSELPELAGAKPEGGTQDALYAHLATRAAAMDIDGVMATLEQLGDKRLIGRTSRLFGKQRFAAFEQEVREMLADPQLRYAEGFDPSAMPDEDAPTILDVMDAIEDRETKILIRDPEFRYTRIGRSTVELSLAEERKAAEKALKEATDDKARKKAQDSLDSLLARTQAQARFEDSQVAKEQGLPIDGIVSHEDRANLSMRFKIPGTVKLEGTPPGVPKSIESARYQTYNVVFGGVTTMDSLASAASEAALAKLQAMKLAPLSAQAGERLVIDLARLAVINRRQVQAASAQRLGEISIQIAQEKASLKVYRDSYGRLFPPKTSAGLAEEYGLEAASWLRHVGVVDGSFNPPRTTLPPTDQIVVPELSISAKGLSSLPKVSEVLERIQNHKKQTGGGTLMLKAIEELKAFERQHPQMPPMLEGEGNTGTPEQKELLDGLIAQANAELKKLKAELEQIRLSVLVAGRWFPDLPSGQDSVEVLHGGTGYSVKIDTREAEITI